MNDHWLSKFHKSEKQLVGLMYQLQCLSASFNDVGNEYMSIKLDEFAYAVKCISEDIRSATSECVSEFVHDAQQSSTALLESILAVCKQQEK